jgi:hypothetical protein
MPFSSKRPFYGSLISLGKENVPRSSGTVPYTFPSVWIKCGISRQIFWRPRYQISSKNVQSEPHRGADKSLARPGKKQTNFSVRMAWISFGALSCWVVGGGGGDWWQLASRCCWNRARPWHASELVSFLVGLRTYQHPGTCRKMDRKTAGCHDGKKRFSQLRERAKINYYFLATSTVYSFLRETRRTCVVEINFKSFVRWNT